MKKKEVKTTNIFTIGGKPGRAISAAYKMLMTRKPVTLKDMILSLYLTEEKKKEVESRGVSNDKYYKPLTKHISLVVSALNDKEEGCIKILTKDGGTSKKGQTYQYIGISDDPLAEEKAHAEKMKWADFVEFLKTSDNIMPSAWLDSLFSGTNELLETKKSKRNGEMVVDASADTMLDNIELLPTLYNYIVGEKVIRITQRPYGGTPKTMIMHPHFLKQYNGRWFLFGRTEMEGKNPVWTNNIPIDRIIGEPEVVDVEYVPQRKGYYKERFKDVVGVTLKGFYNGNNKKDYAAASNVKIKTHSLRMHELLNGKKLHHSQHETIPFQKHEDGTEWGEITLSVVPNNELTGKIMLYGKDLEVTSPPVLRDHIREIVEVLASRYTK